MKKTSYLLAVAFVVGLFSIAYTAQPAIAKNVGNGSDITDTLQIGTITGLSNGGRTITIKTNYEKTAKTYELHALKDAYVMTASRGEFKKFADLKKGDLIAAYGWFKGGKWNARRVDLLSKNDYLIKRLASDAKAGVFYKHEMVGK